MKKLFLFSALLLSSFANAQAVFQKAISVAFSNVPTVKAVAPTSDGGYIIGAEGIGNYNNMAMMIKTDANGQTLWSKTFVYDSTQMSFVFSVGECIGGGYYLFGQRQITSGIYGAEYLTKMDASGNLLWTKTYPTGLQFEGNPSIFQLPNGDFKISTSGSVMGVTETDANGNILSTDRYETDTVSPGKMPVITCALGADGGPLVCGRIAGLDMVKVDPITGLIQWKRSYQDQVTFQPFIPSDIIGTSDGGYALVANGQYSSNSSADESFIIKLDQNGDISWWKNYTYTEGMNLTQIDQEPNGNLIVGGLDGSSHPLIMGLDITGNLNFSGIIGNFTNQVDNSYTRIALCATPDSGFVMAGTCTNTINSASAVTLFKTDNSATFPCNYISIVLTDLTSSSNQPTNVPPPMFKKHVPPQGHGLNTNPVTTTTNVTDFCMLLNLQEQATVNSISVFPSPIVSGENLFLHMPATTGASLISIYDATGKLVQQSTQTVSNATVEIPTTGFNSGIYLVRITNEKKELVGVTKFVVR